MAQDINTYTSNTSGGSESPKKVTGTDVSDKRALDVNVVQTVGGGGGSGTEYTEGATDASITGTAALAEGAADTLRPLQVFELSGNFPLKTAIVDGAGAQITSFGGGTQYTEGDTDASITGTAAMWEDAGNTLRAVSAATPLPIGDAGGSLTIDAASLPLPTGAATSANQLPDGHNVTVDNAAGASAVNIQDGGNSITVDGAVTVSGTVAATQSGTWNINNISGTVSLPTGAATAALQLPNSHDVTIDNAAGASAVNIQDGGNSITVDGTVAVSNQNTQYTEGDTDATITGNAMLAELNDGSNTLQTLKVNVDDALLVSIEDSVQISVDTELPSAATLADNESNGTAMPSVGARLMGFDGTTWDRVRVGTPSADGLSAASLPGFLSTNSNLVYNGSTFDRSRGNTSGNFVQGSAADNAAAVGNPVRTGAVYNSTSPTYANGDISDLQSDDEGNLETAVRRKTQVLTDINTTYDDSPTTATSAALDVRKFRHGMFFAEVTESGAATDIEFTLQGSHDNTNWYDYRHGPWVRYQFDDATISSYGTLTICEPIPFLPSYIRMIVTCAGTDASNTFTVADAYFEVWD